MKNKMFCLAIIICSLFGVRCTEDQKMDYLYPDYIEINFNNSNYQANLQLFIEASKRFDEHVYKDENKCYKTSINKGSDIRISEDLFNLLTKSLKYREQVEILKNKKLNMRINKYLNYHHFFQIKPRKKVKSHFFSSLKFNAYL